MTQGSVLAIARRTKSRAPMELIADCTVHVDKGVEGDSRGTSRKRQVTILALADWQAAIAELGRPDLAWTIRRANFLVNDIVLPRVPGTRLSLGTAVLEVTGQTDPCDRMDEQAPGLKAALTPDWRGGITCRVISGDAVKAGDPVKLL
jgi:MOSC domain-containing protein YiiM